MNLKTRTAQRYSSLSTAGLGYDNKSGSLRQKFGKVLNTNTVMPTPNVQVYSASTFLNAYPEAGETLLFDDHATLPLNLVAS